MLRTLFISCVVLSPQWAHCDWPQWRGSQQNGSAPEGVYPQTWSQSEGIAWQVVLPGRGGSTPIVVGGKIYLTCTTEVENKLLCRDSEKGDPIWSVSLGKPRPSKHGKNHRKGSGSNPSVVFDGDSVFAYFRSGDIGCVSRDGKSLWHINLQDMYGEDTLWWDLGSSPVATDKVIVVPVMHSGASYLVGINKSTGTVEWKVDRASDAPLESLHSYTTPLLLEIDGQWVLAVLGGDYLTLHRIDDGVELARIGGFNPNKHKYFRSIASPVVANNIIVCPYGRGATVTGINASKMLAGLGKDAIEWFRDDIGSDVPSPATRKGKVYILGDKGKVVCLDAETGKDLWDVQLPKSRFHYSSSPLIAGKQLYLTREDGTTYVLDLQADGDLKANNQAGTGQPYTVASLVPLRSDFLLRTREHLIRIQGSK